MGWQSCPFLVTPRELRTALEPFKPMLVYRLIIQILLLKSFSQIILRCMND